MDKHKKYIKLKISVIFIVVMFSLLNFLLKVCIQGFNASIIFLDDYIGSGESLFIPWLPYISLLEFLPTEMQIPQFSLGRLIDIVIIINLVFFTQSGVYHLVTKIFRRDQIDVIDNLEDLESLIIDDTQFRSIMSHQTTATQDKIFIDSTNNIENNKDFRSGILKDFYFYRLKKRILIPIFRLIAILSHNKNFNSPCFSTSHPLFLDSFNLFFITFFLFKIKLISQALNRKSCKITECNLLSLIEL